MRLGPMLGVALSLGLAACGPQAAATVSPDAAPEPTPQPEPLPSLEEAATGPSADAVAAFQIAETLRETTRDRQATIAAYEHFLAEHGDAPTNAEMAVAANVYLGLAHGGAGDEASAAARYREALRIFDAQQMEPGTEASVWPARAQFELAQIELRALEATKLTATDERLAEQTKALFDQLVLANRGYQDVARYMNIEWAIAAICQRAYAHELAGQRIRQAPLPAKLSSSRHARAAYRDEVAAAAKEFETRATGMYAEAVTHAEEYGLVNEWTTRARDRLVALSPSKGGAQ